MSLNSNFPFNYKPNSIFGGPTGASKVLTAGEYAFVNASGGEDSTADQTDLGFTVGGVTMVLPNTFAYSTTQTSATKLSVYTFSRPCLFSVQFFSLVGGATGGIFFRPNDVAGNETDLITGASLVMQPDGIVTAQQAAQPVFGNNAAGGDGKVVIENIYAEAGDRLYLQAVTGGNTVEARVWGKFIEQAQHSQMWVPAGSTLAGGNYNASIYTLI